MKKQILFSCVLTYAAFLFAPIDELVDQRWQYPPVKESVHSEQSTSMSLPGITLTATPNWPAAQKLEWFKGLRCAHFGVHTDGMADSEVGIDICIATRARRTHQQYNLKISIVQQERGSTITVYDKNNELIAGDVPRITGTKQNTNAPLLPWRDGMTIFYSVVVQTIEGKPYVLVIQHTRTQVVPTGQQYEPAAVANMLRTYATAPVLQDRMYGFLDEVTHMRALSLPCMHKNYQFPLAEDVYVTWAATKGAVRVTPRTF